MKIDIMDIMGALGSGAVASTLKGLDNLSDEKVKEMFVTLVRRIVEQPVLGKTRQRRLVGLLRDAASEVFVKDLQ